MPGGRPAELRDAKLVSVWLEREDVEQIKKMGVERSAFVRDAVRRALHGEAPLLKEMNALKEEVKVLRKECELKDRRIRELELEVEHLRGMVARLGGKLQEKVNTKKYRTSFGQLTLEEIKQIYEERKDKLTSNPLNWLSAVLYDNPIAIREVAEALGLQNSSSSLTPSPTPSPASAPAVVIVDAAEDAAEDAEKAENAEKERTERMLRAREPRRRRRMIEEIDFKALAKEWGCSEEEARRIVAERFASSSPPSSPPSSPSSETEGMNSSELIRRARSILEGY
ncbi:MAG: hypothetical protein QKV96_gp01 [Methanophagales virus GBV303]|uniref:Uncharacterized protein n=1 Tax=Methanophagales virus GBV303 TaxID=2986514 RepID=A0A9E8VFI7_9VIRU|nr:MAG: hypothetical protein QKV96_gp01 [Methanophagales virus GBV303]WAE39637.1 MAG: hypothetical protein NNKAGPMP_00001 [Methanophagales virus GBV303]